MRRHKVPLPAVLKHRLRALLLGVRRDRRTGHLYHRVNGARLYLRFPEECVRAAHRREAFEQIYFKRYLPGGKACVVDVGAGLGAEIVELARSAPDIRYIAVEVQPWIYECLCLTLDQLPAGYRAFGLGIARAGPLYIQPTREGIDADAISGPAAVRVETVTWAEFAARFEIVKVDLLKVNIEGGETALLHEIDLSVVRRVLVSVHDFRAERGEGEHFRTRAAVERRLREAGMQVEAIHPNWLFACRQAHSARDKG